MGGNYRPPTSPSPKAENPDGERSENTHESHYHNYPAEDATTVLRRFIENSRKLRWIPRIYGEERYIDKC